VTATHLLDRSLQDFSAVRPTFRPEPDGDLAFDVELPMSRLAGVLDLTDA
jgi:hypothetical protein